MVECTPIKVLQLAILLAHDPFHYMHWPTHTPLVTGNLPIAKVLVARQWPMIVCNAGLFCDAVVT